MLKSHLPLDAIPYYPGTRYIVVVRDARDVFMSLWNHYANLTDAVFAHMNDPAVLIGPPAPRAPADIHEFWDGWINRGWFDWESEGYPHSGNLNHTRSWWAFRHLPNILFVHFNDLLADPRGEIRAVADFLAIPVPDAALTSIAAEVSFAAIKRNAAMAGPMSEEHAQGTWTGGLDTFFFRGTNGRWRGVLDADELAMYRRAKARVLPPDCARYTERGRAALEPLAKAG